MGNKVDKEKKSFILDGRTLEEDDFEDDSGSAQGGGVNQVSVPNEYKAFQVQTNNENERFFDFEADDPFPGEEKIVTKKSPAANGDLVKRKTLARYDKVMAKSKAAAKKGATLRKPALIKDEFDEQSITDPSYNMSDIRWLFFDKPSENLENLLWDEEKSGRQHNWLKLVAPEDVEVDDEDYNYGQMEKALFAEYQKVAKHEGGSSNTTARMSISSPEIEDMKKKLLHQQKEHLKSLKDQSKALDVQIMNRIKELKRQTRGGSKAKLNARNLLQSTRKRIKSNKRIRTMSRLGNLSFRKSFSSQPKSEVESEMKVDATQSSSLLIVPALNGDSKMRAELSELRQLKKDLATESHFPGIMKWKFKSDAGNGLHIGVKDIEIANLDCQFSLTGKSSSKGKTITLECDNLQANIGILELALKGKGMASMLGGIINPTITKLFLILRGSFKVSVIYNTSKEKWMLAAKNIFKLAIQKQVDGVKSMVLPTSLINLLGKIIIPKLIATSFRDMLPHSLETFDDTFRSKLKETLKKYGFPENVIERSMPSGTSFLANNLNDFIIEGTFRAEGDLDFNIWRAPLTAPTKVAAAARRALKFHQVDDAIQLDYLLRSARAEKSGFSSKESVSIEKLYSWRLKFASFQLPELKPLIEQMCLPDDDVDEGAGLIPPAVLYSIFERVETLAEKPVNFTVSISKVECKFNCLEIYQNIQQHNATREALEAKTPADMDKAFTDILEGLETAYNLIRLKGELSGNLSFLLSGPLTRGDGSRNPKNKNVKVRPEMLGTGDLEEHSVGDDYGALMVKIDNAAFKTNLKVIQSLKETAEEATSTFPIAMSTKRRDDNSKEVIFAAKLLPQPKKRKDSFLPLMPIPKQLTLRKEEVKEKTIDAEFELGILGARADMFPHDQTFGSLVWNIELAQCYIDNFFLDAYYQHLDRLSAANNEGLVRFPQTREFLKNNIAPMLKKRGFLLSALTNLRQDILAQTEALLLQLDGATTTKSEQLLHGKHSKNRSFLEFLPFPELIQDPRNEFLLQARNLPVVVTSDGTNLILECNKQNVASTGPHSGFLLQMRFRRNLSDLLARE